MSAQGQLEQLDAMFARLDVEDGYNKRAWRIVDRILPLPPGGARHGFYDPAGFLERAQIRGQRKRMQLRIFAKLRAKAEGGVPFIAVPKNVPHLFGPGDALFDVARELELEAAAR